MLNVTFSNHHTQLLYSRGVTMGDKGDAIPRASSHYGGTKSLREHRMAAWGTKKSKQCRKQFLQYNTFASERRRVRTQGGQTCFLPRAPSNLVTPLLYSVKSQWQNGYRWRNHMHFLSWSSSHKVQQSDRDRKSFLKQRYLRCSIQLCKYANVQKNRKCFYKTNTFLKCPFKRILAVFVSITFTYIPRTISTQKSFQQGRTQEFFKGGGLKFWEKYFALTKVQATLFAVTFMSYMLFQF